MCRERKQVLADFLADLLSAHCLQVLANFLADAPALASREEAALVERVDGVEAALG